MTPSALRRRLVLLAAALALLLAAVALVGACVSFGPPSPEEAFRGRPRPESRVVALPGGRRLHVEATGPDDGRLVLFVHGTPGSWNDFAHVMADPVLASRARLVSIDRPGWGGSSERLEPALADQASALAELLKRRASGLPAIVVGFSLGGPIAARLAMDDPRLVAGLVLVSPSIDPELEGTTWYQAIGRWPLVHRLLPDALARADEELRPLAGELRRLLPRWSEITVPVTVLQGDDDALVDPASADFAERVLTRAPVTVERIPDQGHLIPWERPELIATAVLDLLERPVGRGAAAAP